MTVRRHVSNDFFAFQYFIVRLGLGVLGGGTFLCVALDYFVARRRLRDMINLFESIERGWFNRPVKEETMQANYKTMELALRNALNDLAILAGEKMGPSDASPDCPCRPAKCSTRREGGELFGFSKSQ